MLSLLFVASFLFCGCTKVDNTQNDNYKWGEMKVEESLPLEYATQFTVDYYEGGYTLITIGDTDRYLIVPENMSCPEGLDKDIYVMYKPFNKVYLAATSAMDLIRAIGGLDNVAFSGTKADDWYIDEAKDAMENGFIKYAGKYSAPDFELLISGGCNLAVESTMILHNPEIREQLLEVGIPVLVERSSYESHPLGRMEWIKLYGVLMDKTEEAEQYFDSQVDAVADIMDRDDTGLTVAFFYVTANGSVNIRKSGDYVSKMIELAGGEYIFADMNDDENALSTTTIQMEEFYAKAKDADILIYNSTIAGTLPDMESLLKLSDLFNDFKAVQSGNVFCTEKNMFQESTGFGDMILDINKILTDSDVSDDELTYLYRLK